LTSRKDAPIFAEHTDDSLVEAGDMRQSHYMISGGVEGRERLRVVSRVMRPTTLALFERVGVRPGLACLDVGCGGGDVTRDLARLVAQGGRVVGTDIDETKLALARGETGEQRLDNVEFHLADINRQDGEPLFDLVYARFLLTHMTNPSSTLHKMRSFIRAGGLLVVEDIDISGHFCHPDSPALRRYVELYTQTALKRGCDPNVGLKLPRLLTEAGLAAVEMNVAQPAGTDLETKLVNALTMEGIADSVVEEELAPQEEVDRLVAELYELAQDHRALASIARIIQAWGRMPTR